MHSRIRFTNSTKYAKIMIYFTSIILPFIFVGLILNGAPLINSINLTLLPILCSILFYFENYCINNKTNKKIINNLNIFITKYFKVPIFFQSDFWRSLNIILITYIILFQNISLLTFILSFILNIINAITILFKYEVYIHHKN